MNKYIMFVYSRMCMSRGKNACQQRNPPKPHVESSPPKTPPELDEGKSKPSGAL